VRPRRGTSLLELAFATALAATLLLWVRPGPRSAPPPRVRLAGALEWALADIAGAARVRAQSPRYTRGISHRAARLELLRADGSRILYGPAPDGRGLVRRVEPPRLPGRGPGSAPRVRDFPGVRALFQLRHGPRGAVRVRVAA